MKGAGTSDGLPPPFGPNTLVVAPAPSFDPPDRTPAGCRYSPRLDRPQPAGCPRYRPLAQPPTNSKLGGMIAAPDNSLIRAARPLSCRRVSPLRGDALAGSARSHRRDWAYRALRSKAPTRTRTVDLRPLVLTPGLVDSHTHLFYWALQRALVVDVSGLRSPDETLIAIRRGGRTKRIGEWTVARGFDQNLWGGDFPTATDLDRAIRDRPVVVHSRDGHSAWLNTRGLRAAGVTPRRPDPPGGRFLRDSRGRPSGVVQEAALDLLPDPVADFARRTDARALAVVDAALDDAYRIARQHGLVGVHSMDDAPSLNHLQRQHRDGRLGLRIVHAIQLAQLDRALALGLRTGLGDEWLRLGAVKIFSDGALGSQTALMFDDYPGRAGYVGVGNVAGEALAQAAVKAARHGWALWIHAIGDRAVHEAVVALRAARRVEECPLPHRIEHAQCLRPADVRRMAHAGITASMQPCHLLGDIATADRQWPKARRNAYAFRALLDAGVTLAFGSDAPIESLDPRRSFFGAVARTDEAGQPDGGWFAQQRLTIGETLHAFTRGAAASLGLPAPYGDIAVGAPADLTLWRDDPPARGARRVAEPRHRRSGHRWRAIPT